MHALEARRDPAALLLDCARELTPPDCRTMLCAAPSKPHISTSSPETRAVPRRSSKTSSPRSRQVSPRERRSVVIDADSAIRTTRQTRTLFLQVLDEAESESSSPCDRSRRGSGMQRLGLQRFDEGRSSTRSSAVELDGEVSDEALFSRRLLSRLTTETLLGRPTASASRACLGTSALYEPTFGHR